MARPTSIKIFLADGTPDGIRIVGKSNWTGRAIVASRAQLQEALARDELSRPGVYVLVGADESGSAKLYVGEADVLAERLRKGEKEKDFWTNFIAFTSTDANLNKGLIRYLESKLITLARAANQWELDNGTAPKEPPLSEADRADADWFLEEMLVIYPILGVDAFEAASTDEAAPGAEEDLMLSQSAAEGRGRETKDGFVVLSGSRARTTERRSIPTHLKDLRQKLVARGVLVPQGDHLLFTQDYRFASPSMAAGVLIGGAANGRTAWRSNGGRTLKDAQTARAND